MEAARAFGVLFLEAIGLALIAPALSALRLRAATAVAVGVLVLGFAIARLTAPLDGIAGPQLAAHGLLAGFVVLLAGLGATARRVGGPGARALATLLGLAILASPFLADPILEDPDRQVRPFVRETVLWLNPLAGAASAPLLRVDWLRQPIAYRSTTLGPYHAYHYPDPLRQGGLFFAAGVLLLLLGRRRIG